MASAEILAALKTLHNSTMMFNPSAYSYTRSLQDGNGIFTKVEYFRRNDTKIAQSVLSDLVTGHYTTETVTFYNDAGTTATVVVVWQLAYNVNGDLLSRTFVSETPV